MDKIEKQWDEFGAKNPYFAVSTYEKFYTENLNEDALNEFFESGDAYADRIWHMIESNLKPDFHPERSLDFGCGVGRLSIPIARRSETAVGVDISQRMLDEARRNAEKFKIGNIEFVKSDDELSRLSGKFDFVHSFIVIQHIDPNLGERIFERLIDLLEDGGVGALHLTYHHPGGKGSVLRYKVYRRFPLVYKIRNILLRKKKEPLIPVYTYDLNRIFKILQNKKCHSCFVRFSEHGHLGIHIFFEKNADYVF